MMEELQQQQIQQPVIPVTGEVRFSENSIGVNASDVDFTMTDGGSYDTVLKKKRGRPPKGTLPPHPRLKKPKDEEDVCFICFDGGSLVLCDYRGCPKAYHPACVKRDEEFFRLTEKWNCGWHLCSDCGKSCHYMCYTCTYSLCKGCTKKESDFVSVRGNKGLCGACKRTIMLIENSALGIKCEVDFDDKSSWEYLFKVYWMYLKGKLSLDYDEIHRAKNPWKSAVRASCKAQTPRKLHHLKVDNGYGSENSCVVDSNSPKNKKVKENIWTSFLDGAGHNAQDLSTTCELNGNTCVIKNQIGPNESAIDDATNPRFVRLREPVWHYQDPNGNVHGPVSMLFLCKLKGTERIPPDLRIWRIDEKQENSILLSDALSFKCSQKVSLPLNCEQQSLRASVTLETTTENSHGGLSNETRSANNQTVKQGEAEKVGDTYTPPNGTDESVKSNGGHTPSPGLTTQADGNISDGQSGHFERREASPKCDISCHDGPNVHPALPSIAFDEKLIDKPSDKVVEGHGNEQKSEVNGNLGSNRCSEDPSNSGQSDQKQSDNEENSGQSSGQNWRGPSVIHHPPMDASSWIASIFGDTDCPLVDDSVSDLLEQVAAKEKDGVLETPTAIEWDDELTEGAITDCFSFAANALSPMLDAGKGDALSSSSDLHLPSQSNAAEEPFRQADVHNHQTICGEQSSKAPEVESTFSRISWNPTHQFSWDPTR
ncbi:unnamed protein product [Trifolium pratense]|uniref:Uncharacterized protein n=1 Tax=Trifolium pratense TaxID=57577 RepID=A0ACB0JR83_TRIPR|nr:unnamed protein product [Trifolium pratense]